MKTAQITKSRAKASDANILLKTLIGFKKGRFSVRMPVDQIGIEGKIADKLNDILELNQKMVSEFARISRAVGNLVQPSTEVARVIGAVAKGDLSQTMSLEVDGRPLRGEFLHTARVVNTMVDQLNSFASEAAQVAVTGN